MQSSECMRLSGHSVVLCRCNTPSGFLECPREARFLTPTYPPEAYRRARAELQREKQSTKPHLIYSRGAYSGNICDACGGTRMRRAGTCEVCDDCGTAGGCG
jgi:hypothetical protein